MYLVPDRIYICNTNTIIHSSKTRPTAAVDIDKRTTTRPRHTSSAAACTDWSGRVQAHTRPALLQELSLRHRGRTMRWMCEPSSGVVDEPLALCCCCEPEFDPALLLIESWHDALDSPSTPCIRVLSPLAWGRNNVRELRAQRRHVLGDGGCGSIPTPTFFRTAVRSGYLLRTAACSIPYKYLIRTGTWYQVRDTCGVRIIRKKGNACFYIEQRTRFYTRTEKFKNEVTN